MTGEKTENSIESSAGPANPWEPFDTRDVTTPTYALAANISQTQFVKDNGPDPIFLGNVAEEATTDMGSQTPLVVSGSPGAQVSLQVNFSASYTTSNQEYFTSEGSFTISIGDLVTLNASGGSGVSVTPGTGFLVNEPGNGMIDYQDTTFMDSTAPDNTVQNVSFSSTYPVHVGDIINVDSTTSLYSNPNESMPVGLQSNTSTFTWSLTLSFVPSP